MRFACLLPAALLLMGCGVPQVTFADGGGSHDAARDSSNPLDGPSEAASDGEADAEGDASGDAADSGDAGSDAPEFCQGDAGAPPGPSYKCCGAIGTVCNGNCNAQACLACGVCTWPSVCCPTMGNMGHCSADGGC